MSVVLDNADLLPHELEEVAQPDHPEVALDVVGCSVHFFDTLPNEETPGVALEGYSHLPHSALTTSLLDGSNLPSVVLPSQVPTYPTLNGDGSSSLNF